jgi:DNA adenine methylase
MMGGGRVTWESSERVRPVLKWAGGKSGLLSQLLPLFPGSFCRYFEPFFGGGAVYFALGFRGVSILNDSNPELVELYEVVRDVPHRLMCELDVLSSRYSEGFYYELRSTVPCTREARAARTIFLNKTGYNGLYRQNSKGMFNVPFGKRVRCPTLYQRDNLVRVAESLANARFHCFDFEEVIDGAGAGDFIYCDPPYEPLSRSSSFNAYQGGGFSQVDQIRLKDACMRARGRGAQVIISNSSAEFVKELYSDCCVEIVSARRAINSKGTSRGAVDEVAVLLTP